MLNYNYSYNAWTNFFFAEKLGAANCVISPSTVQNTTVYKTLCPTSNSSDSACGNARKFIAPASSCDAMTSGI